MYQPYPSSSRPAEPLRPRAPGPVLTAVKLMYAGAAVSAVVLIILLAMVLGDVKGAVRGQFLGHSLTEPQLKPLIITVVMVGGLAVIALWLWIARANGQGRSWARTLSTVLFGLATLQLAGDLRQPVSHAGFGVTVLSYGVTALSAAAWLAGGAAVRLLWHPASTAFLKPQGFTQTLPRHL
jgi:hypothetical protein